MGSTMRFKKCQKHYLNAVKVNTTIFILKELISTVQANFSLAKRSEVYCFISLKR